MLDLITMLCCCGCAALGSRKRKQPCLIEAEGWHLQSTLGDRSMEGCVSLPPETHWSKAGNCLGESQEWRFCGFQEAGMQQDCSR